MQKENGEGTKKKIEKCRKKGKRKEKTQKRK